MWCYELCSVSDDCDPIVDELYSGLLDGFWPPERPLIEEGYRSIRMPGAEIDAPPFDMRAEWRVGDMLGYLRTWSACKRYEEARGADPVAEVEPRLVRAWGNDARVVRWPLSARICRL